MVGNAGLAYGFYDHPSLFEGAAVALQGPVLAVKGHLEPGSLEPIAVSIFVQIGILDDKFAVRLFAGELAGRVDRMNDGKTGAPTVLQYSGDFEDRWFQIIDVLQRHKGDRKIRASILQR